ncbi:2187_t:CDS:1 [Ambispora gerdemannii]|uniref:2187_t:CDS:1 n=1 Tax=Ambispora gerdemannii TaxID=144530 RepID=A0A9N9BM05_9GLOM|nr:2187_t:CDS:1 [Ambispora gerdemannii]
MKIVIITLLEQKIAGCNVFQPSHIFDAEWCLDLHGFRNRQAFEDQLRDINNFITQYPLLSERAKKFIMKTCGGVCLFIALILIITIYTQASSFIFPGIIIEICLAVGYYVAQRVIENIATRRARIFNTAVKGLFTQYNLRDNPTANWTLVWRTTITHYTINATSIDGNIKGEITPKFAEYVEIVLEINDALSDLTAHTVHVKNTEGFRSLPPATAATCTHCAHCIHDPHNQYKTQ